MGKHNSEQSKELIVKWKSEGKSYRELIDIVNMPYSTLKYIVDSYKNRKIIQRKNGSGGKKN